jgi:hypothetical protein
MRNKAQLQGWYDQSGLYIVMRQSRSKHDRGERLPLESLISIIGYRLEPSHNCSCIGRRRIARYNGGCITVIEVILSLISFLGQQGITEFWQTSKQRLRRGRVPCRPTFSFIMSSSFCSLVQLSIGAFSKLSLRLE